MNEEYIKEYEEMSLCDFADELVEPLYTIKKDLTKTIYIHYAEERDKNEQLAQENARLKEERKQIKEYVKKCNFDNAEILYDFGSEYCYIDDFKEHILEIFKEN